MIDDKMWRTVMMMMIDCIARREPRKDQVMKSEKQRARDEQTTPHRSNESMHIP